MEREECRRRELAKVALGEISAADLNDSMKNIKKYLKPYKGLLGRNEQQQHMYEIVTGFTSDLERKSAEPIAVMHGTSRYALQHFIGGSTWDWEPFTDLLCREVSAEIGISDGTLAVDGSAFPKKGEATVGVSRQWCGRLGKIENCVVGVYASYIGRDNASALVGAELYLPEDWISDKAKMAMAHVPMDTKFRTKPAIAADLLNKLHTKVPYQWVLGDDEFGRVQAFRDQIRALLKYYVVDVPNDTVVRRVRKGTEDTFERKRWKVRDLRKRIPVHSWAYFHIRDGEKGPIEVRATSLPVVTKREDNSWVKENLVIAETLDGRDIWFYLAHSPESTPLSELVRRASLRHRIEEVFEEAKGEVGLDHFETRSWQGWHHHMVLGMIAHWFLLREKRRLGKKNARLNNQHDSPSDRTSSISLIPNPFSTDSKLSPLEKRRSETSALQISRPDCTTASSSKLFISLR